MELRSFQNRLLLFIAFLVIFISPTSFRIREYADKSLDLQTGIKLVGIAISLMVPILSVISGRISGLHKSLVLWLLFLIILVFSSSYAPQLFVSLTDSIAFLGCFLFCLWMTDRFGEIETVCLVIFTVSVICAISLIVYFVYPDLGRMHAWLGSEFGTNGRITGIAGSPNGLGSMTSLTLIFSFLYFRYMGTRQQILVLACAPLALICLIMSDNRMSMLALALCGSAWLIARGNKAANMSLLGLSVLVIALVFFSAPDLIMSHLARSGDAQEITTGTGRAIIWSVVLEMVALKPVLGYGYAAATSILPNDPRLFSVAAHTHNMYLEVLFSGGIVASLVFAMSLLSTIYYGIKNTCFEPLIIIFFFLFRGLTEPTPFSGLPAFGGYAFLLAISFVAARSRNAQYALSRNEKQQSFASLERCRANLQTTQLVETVKP